MFMTQCRCEKAEVSKDSPTFIFRGNRFFFCTHYPWTRKQGEFLQRLRPFSQWHSVTQQKAWFLSSTSWGAVSSHVHYLECKCENSTANIQWGWGVWDWYRLWIEGGGGDQWYVVNNAFRWWPRYLKFFNVLTQKGGSDQGVLDMSRTVCVLDKTLYTHWWQLPMLETIASRLQTRLVWECRGFPWRC